MWVKIPSDKSNDVITSRRRRSIILGFMLCLSIFFSMLFDFGWLTFLTFSLFFTYIVFFLFDLGIILFFEKGYRLKALVSFGINALFLAMFILSAFLGMHALPIKFKMLDKPQYEEFGFFRLMRT